MKPLDFAAILVALALYAPPLVYLADQPGLFGAPVQLLITVAGTFLLLVLLVLRVATGDEGE